MGLEEVMKCQRDAQLENIIADRNQSELTSPKLRISLRKISGLVDGGKRFLVVGEDWERATDYWEIARSPQFPMFKLHSQRT